ncbi:MAG TPA: pyridoxamine 5'-phosphate oxidase [Phycisphaeraceae bacterium]
MSSLADLRREFAEPGLREEDLLPDPIEQFGRWLEEARQAGILDPNAMTLATCGADGTPSARIMLLKGFDAEGFTFFTNYQSDKAADLADNPRAALLFYWDKLSRCVRITGVVGRVPREQSEAYFATRPRGSQLGAWASCQSRVVPDRATLEQRFAELEQQYAGQPVPTPPHWGGYRLRPQRIEFWQGQPSRLHDRLRYARQPDGTWRMERLSP